MRKLKKISWTMLIITTLLMIGLNGYDLLTADKKAPVIMFPGEELQVSVAVTEEELLQDVQARDNRSGDLTGSVVVEKMSSIAEDSTRVVTYAAIDKAGNVGRKERTIRYTDYVNPRFDLGAPLRFPIGKFPDDIMGSVFAESAIDGEITEKVKFQFVSEQYFNQEGFVDIEIRVTDSAGVTSVLPTQLEWYDPKNETLQVELSQYIVYLEEGAAFEPKDYYIDAGQKSTLEVESDVNTSVPGVYHVNYLVKAGDNIGKSRLVVVVE